MLLQIVVYDICSQISAAIIALRMTKLDLVNIRCVRYQRGGGSFLFSLLRFAMDVETKFILLTTLDSRLKMSLCSFQLENT